MTQLVASLNQEQPHSFRFFDLLVSCIENLKNKEFIVKSQELVDSIKKFCSRIFSSEIVDGADQPLYGAFKLKSLLVSKNLIEEEETTLL